MTIYEKYAETLINLHKCYHNLVLEDFRNQPNFNKYNYENKIGFNWEGILFKERHSNKPEEPKNVFPMCPLYNSETHGLFSMEYRSYSGLIAKKKAIKIKKQIADNNPEYWYKYPNGKFKDGKLGLFDIYVNTGNRYSVLFNDEPTHYNLFADLFRNSSYPACERVWIGEEPIEVIAVNSNEYEALLALSLMMFEQEINYGEEVFQQYTNFKISQGFRPRDMIMGFIRMVFGNVTTFENYPYWELSKNPNKSKFKVSPHFGGKYDNLNDEYKAYFEHFRNNTNYQAVKPLFSNVKLKERFLYYAEKAAHNPLL